MGRVQGVRTPPLRLPAVFWYSAKKTMWFIGVEVEQETSAPPPKKNPGSAPEFISFIRSLQLCPSLSRFFFFFEIYETDIYYEINFILTASSHYRVMF